MSAILVAGGAGYIGSHTCVELLNAGYDVVVVDNLSNSSKESLNRVKQITGKDVKFYEADVADQPKMREIFEENKIFAVDDFSATKPPRGLDTILSSCTLHYPEAPRTDKYRQISQLATWQSPYFHLLTE